MTASQIDQITDQMIRSRLVRARLSGCIVEWTGRMPADPEQWTDAARERLAEITDADVRFQLANDLCGNSPEEEIDMAISMAAEPDELPENGCVALHSAE